MNFDFTKQQYKTLQKLFNKIFVVEFQNTFLTFDDNNICFVNQQFSYNNVFQQFVNQQTINQQFINQQN